MPDYVVREVRAAMIGKLGGREEEDRRHRAYSFHDADGTFLGQTYLSHGHRTIDVSLLKRMARELGVRLADFRGALECPVSQAEFYALMRNSQAP